MGPPDGGGGIVIPVLESYTRPQLPCHGGCGPRALFGGGPDGGGGSCKPTVPEGALGYRGGGGGMLIMLFI